MNLDASNWTTQIVLQENVRLTLREKCPNTEFFSGPYFLIRTEYGDLRSKFPYSVRIQENTDQKKTPYLDTFHAV